MTLKFDDLPPAQQALMPNLFIIGASKCGTTSLHSYLSAHPEICCSLEKEPSFFVDNDELRGFLLMESMRPEASKLDAYLGLFPGGEDCAYRVEASPTYSCHPRLTGVAGRIRAASPQARILYCVRNPVDRAISHYWQYRKTLKEKRSLEDAFAGSNIYVDTSDYGDQLDRYFPHFEQVLLMATEDLRDDPRGVMRRLFTSLDLSEIDLPDDLLVRRNRTKSTVRKPRMGAIVRLRDTVAWNWLRARLSKSTLDKIRHMTVTEEAKDPSEEIEVREKLRAHFQPKVKELDARFGTSFYAKWFEPESAADEIGSPVLVQSPLSMR